MSVQLRMATSTQHVVDTEELATSTLYDTDIKELSTSTNKELEMLTPLSSECCIYRVPERLRQSNEQHYAPQVVSIGPIHYGKPELSAMEEHKKRYLQDFLKLSEASLEECYKLVKINETKLRNCYEHVVDLNSQNFIKMVLIDAVFLVMLFLLNYFNFRSLSRISSIDRVFKKPKRILDISRSKIFSDYDFNEATAMIILAYERLKRSGVIRIPQIHPPAKAEHVLALLRSCLKPANWGPERKMTETFMTHSIKELHQAGIKFQVGSKENIFDIKYKDGVLEIPFLSVHDYTELVFRNLQAFEICHDLDNLCIDYFVMMQQFTMASTDVDVLIERGVIENGLPNSQSLSKLFHDLSPGNLFYWSRFGYTDVIKGLNAYYAVKWNKWKATWLQRNFKAPWAIFSFRASPRESLRDSFLLIKRVDALKTSLTNSLNLNQLS